MLKEEALKLHVHKKVPSLLVHHCTRDIPVFQEVAQLSQNKNLRYAEMLRKRALIFALLSVFLEDTQFIPLLLNVLQPNMRTRVCTVINNNIAHEWTLARIASELLMSPSLLKKKLREEGTSYSQLLTECRMQRALQLIVIYVFHLRFSKLLWDDAHRVSGAIGAGITELWLGGKYGCARDFLRH